MDARLDPAKFAGLSEGDAHVIRNAGGRASDDAIRSLVISYKLLGTQEFFVIHHTDCGMALFTDAIIRDLLANSLETAAVDQNGWRDVGAGPGSDAGEFIDWLTFKDPTSAVVTDVRRIRNHPLVPSRIPIYGFVYDVRTGKLIEVPEATQIGAAKAKVVPKALRSLDFARVRTVGHAFPRAAGRGRLLAGSDRPIGYVGQAPSSSRYKNGGSRVAIIL
jgi:carbonic anhydrase